MEYVHSTKLKDKILSYFQDMEAHKTGQDMMLMFNSDIGCVLTKACEYDSDSDAICLARAAKIVRREMFKMKKQFLGSFETKCQEESIPTSLLTLVAVILHGPNIELQSFSYFQPFVTVSQLLMYNCLVRR